VNGTTRTLDARIATAGLGLTVVAWFALGGTAGAESVTSCEDRAAALVAQMTLEEKVGQMTMADLSTVRDSPELVATHSLGAVLSGGDSFPTSGIEPDDWRRTVEALHAAALESRLGIPLLYGIDAVHGHASVAGAVVFPHNIGLGCTRDPALVERIAAATAAEVRSTGIDWTFSPVVAAARDERWGRTYEAFGEDPALAGELGAAVVRGLQGSELGRGSVLATAKHFAGDGATLYGTSPMPGGLLDRGDVRLDEAPFRALAVDPFRPALAAGVGSVMVSFNSVRGRKAHGSRELVTGLLRDELRFGGIVLSDWEGHRELGGSLQRQASAAINAGIDMLMEPTHWQDLLRALGEAAEAGDIPPERIDDAVDRILAVKCEMGLLDADAPSPVERIGTPEHRALAREAVQRSLVLLQNERSVLPLAQDARILVAGPAADDLARQCGGWTLGWQGDGSRATGTTILQAIREAGHPDRVTFSADGSGGAGHDVAVVVVGEPPYAEWKGDRADLALAPDDRAVIQTAATSGIPVVVVLISGRPLIIDPTTADAWIAAWLPGTEGAGVADVLFGDAAPSGELSHSWPRTMAQIPINVGDPDYESDPPLYPYGYGLGY
jgi:beta-glucosidase